jgi:hypothetical protein
MIPAFSLLASTSDSMSAPILADIDNRIWIFIAIAIGSFIVDWLKKKKQIGETDTVTDESESHRPATTTTSRPPATRPVATSDWEEELRRLLGGEPPSAPKPPPAQAPPPIRPIVIESPTPTPGLPPVTDAAAGRRSGSSSRAGTALSEAEKLVDVRLPVMKESVTAYQRASHLQEQVSERLKHVEEITERHLVSVPTAHRKSVSAEAVRAIALIRNRTTVRQAVIAGLIFGAPKGLENE